MSSPDPSIVSESASFRIGALLYFESEEGRLLLMRRKRQPNRGLWCAVGGKLEMPTGESPYECACREAQEELGIEITATDLRLSCILSEKNYEGTGHWLMFVFLVTRKLERLPVAIDEGEFAFFARSDLSEIRIPELDRRILQEKVLPAGEGLHVLRVDGDDCPLIEEAVLGL